VQLFYCLRWGGIRQTSRCGACLPGWRRLPAWQESSSIERESFQLAARRRPQNGHCERRNRRRPGPDPPLLPSFLGKICRDREHFRGGSVSKKIGKRSRVTARFRIPRTRAKFMESSSGGFQPRKRVAATQPAGCFRAFQRKVFGRVKPKSNFSAASPAGDAVYVGGHWNAGGPHHG